MRKYGIVTSWIFFLIFLCARFISLWHQQINTLLDVTETVERHSEKYLYILTDKLLMFFLSLYGVFQPPL